MWRGAARMSLQHVECHFVRVRELQTLAVDELTCNATLTDIAAYTAAEFNRRTSWAL